MKNLETKNVVRTFVSDLTKKPIEFKCTRSIPSTLPDGRTQVHTFWISKEPIEGIPDVEDYYEPLEMICVLPKGAVDVDVKLLDSECLTGDKGIPENALEFKGIPDEDGSL